MERKKRFAPPPLAAVIREASGLHPGDLTAQRSLHPGVEHEMIGLMDM
jgi:hypothetical protein